MKKNLLTKVSALLMVALMAAMSLCAIALAETATEVVEEASEVLGQGALVFTFEVTDGEGAFECFEIHTDAETVGTALQELGLIEGEESSYGLYVKTVNGVTADYDKDGTYWAFYINGEYAMTGVDSTPAETGAVYAFKVQK